MAAAPAQPPTIDRRRHPRVPLAGPALWRGPDRSGVCQLLDLSPIGAALLVPQPDAVHVRGPLRVAAHLHGFEWLITNSGRVVIIVPHDENHCRVCLAFGEQEFGPLPAPVGV